MDIHTNHGVSELFCPTALLRSRKLDHLFSDMATRDEMLRELEEFGVQIWPMGLAGTGNKYVLQRDGRLRLRDGGTL
jgi:hypothetical protein